MPITRPGSRLRRKIKDSLPKISDGIWLRNPDTGGETYVPFDHLHEIAKDIMHPANASAVEAELGKMHYTKDPTYNMRRK